MRTADDETPATVLIDAHYHAIGLDQGWSLERANRLCQKLGCTLHELGKLYCVDFKTMNLWIGRKRFPPHIALHFALCEAWYVEAVQGRSVNPMVPVHLLKGESHVC